MGLGISIQAQIDRTPFHLLFKPSLQLVALPQLIVKPLTTPLVPYFP